MDVRTILFIAGISGTLVLLAINLYLVGVVRKQQKEIERLQPPFQGVLGSGCLPCPDIIKFKINVPSPLYNVSMKKNKKPLNKVNEATRKAHSKALFESLMLNPHLVVTPANRKGSRQANKQKAIKESY